VSTRKTAFIAAAIGANNECLRAGKGTVKSSMKKTKDILPQRLQRSQGNADLEIKAE